MHQETGATLGRLPLPLGEVVTAATIWTATLDPKKPLLTGAAALWEQPPAAAHGSADAQGLPARAVVPEASDTGAGAPPAGWRPQAGPQRVAQMLERMRQGRAAGVVALRDGGLDTQGDMRAESAAWAGHTGGPGNAGAGGGEVEEEETEEEGRAAGAMDIDSDAEVDAGSGPAGARRRMRYWGELTDDGARAASAFTAGSAAAAAAAAVDVAARRGGSVPRAGHAPQVAHGGGSAGQPTRGMAPSSTGCVEEPGLMHTGGPCSGLPLPDLGYNSHRGSPGAGPSSNTIAPGAAAGMGCSGAHAPRGGDQMALRPQPGGDQVVLGPQPGGDQVVLGPQPGGDQVVLGPQPGGSGESMHQGCESVHQGRESLHQGGGPSHLEDQGPVQGTHGSAAQGMCGSEGAGGQGGMGSTVAEQRAGPLRRCLRTLQQLQRRLRGGGSGSTGPTSHGLALLGGEDEDAAVVEEEDEEGEEACDSDNGTGKVGEQSSSRRADAATAAAPHAAGPVSRAAGEAVEEGYAQQAGGRASSSLAGATTPTGASWRANSRAGVGPAEASSHARIAWPGPWPRPADVHNPATSSGSGGAGAGAAAARHGLSGGARLQGVGSSASAARSAAFARAHFAAAAAAGGGVGWSWGARGTAARAYRSMDEGGGSGAFGRPQQWSPAGRGRDGGAGGRGDGSDSEEGPSSSVERAATAAQMARRVMDAEAESRGCSEVRQAHTVVWQGRGVRKLNALVCARVGVIVRTRALVSVSACCL